MLEPDRAAIEIHVNAVFRYAGADGYVHLKAFYHDNKVYPTPPVRMNGSLVPLVDAAADYARRCGNEPKAIVFCPPTAVFRTRDGATENDLLRGLVLSVELDENPREGRAALEQILGPPTEVVRSGGLCVDGAPKLHVYWRLRRPAEGGEALAALKRARRLATRIAGGDASNDSVVHPIRMPGSWHRKGEPRLCEIESVDPDIEIDLDDALAALTAAAPAEQSSARDNGHDAGERADWAELIANILAGRELHGSLTRLAAAYVASGMDEPSAVRTVEALFLASSMPRDERWKARFDEIPRAVHSAQAKYGQAGERPKVTFDEDFTEAGLAELGEWNVGDDEELWGHIPPREWLLGNIFCRGFLSSLLAEGGTGKTALRVTQLISLACGRALTGEHVFQRCRVLIVSLEDSARELRRRIRATCEYHNVSRAELDGWLFIVTLKACDGKLMVLDRARRPIRGVLIDKLAKTITTRRIDIVSLDPFVKAHRVEENLNSAIDEVVELLTDLCEAHNLSVDTPHHTSKGAADPGNASRGRGASAMKDAARLVYTLTQMTSEEAEALGVGEGERRSLIRMDSGKVNIAPPMTEAKWFRLVGVPIGNATKTYPNGDNVQTVEPWSPKNIWRDLSIETIDMILGKIKLGLADGRRYSAHAAAKERAAWPVIISHCAEATQAQARQVIKRWLKSGLLVERSYRNEAERKDELGLYIDEDKRQAMKKGGGE